ncbi:hypothetical protein CBR_g36663 [Chara braunii]|uniref:MalT-like TPR region domain-containing protein n=1 Tax=Chara braunii TaxID=69332 RepID=A0A388LLE7_CHABU|nr:hypothetical protein CBR_g36663 [Chara braunii]|eukprot:GBG83045.1 hypothetical protein CBR_g36663 [Chara braunii]
MDQTDKAISELKAALVAVKRDGNWKEQGRLLNQLGHAFKKKGDYINAKKYFREDYDLTYTKYNEKQAQLDEFLPSLQALGDINYTLRDFDEALRLQYKHYSMAEMEDDVVEKERASTQLGRTHLDLFEEKGEREDAKHHLVDAEQYLKTSLKLCVNQSWTGERLANAYNNMGLLELLRKDYLQSKKYLKKAQACCDEEEATEALSRIYNTLGRLYMESGNKKRALEMMKRDQQICRELRHVQGEAKALLNIGELHIENREYDEALANLKQGLALAKLLQDELVLVNGFRNDISVARQLRDGMRDLKALEKRLKSVKTRLQQQEGGGGEDEHSIRLRISELLKRLVELAESLCMWEEVAHLGRQLIAHQEELGDDVGLADAYNHVGLAYYEMGKHPDAEDILRKAVETAIKSGSCEAQATAHLNLGNVLDSRFKHDEALASFQLSFEIAQLEGAEKHLKLQVKALENVHFIYSEVFHDEDEAKHAEEVVKKLKELLDKEEGMSPGKSDISGLGVETSSFGEVDEICDDVDDDDDYDGDVTNGNKSKRGRPQRPQRKVTTRRNGASKFVHGAADSGNERPCRARKRTFEMRKHPSRGGTGSKRVVNVDSESGNEDIQPSRTRQKVMSSEKGRNSSRRISTRHEHQRALEINSESSGEDVQERSHSCQRGLSKDKGKNDLTTSRHRCSPAQERQEIKRARKNGPTYERRTAGIPNAQERGDCLAKNRNPSGATNEPSPVKSVQIDLTDGMVSDSDNDEPETLGAHATGSRRTTPVSKEGGTCGSKRKAGGHPEDVEEEKWACHSSGTGGSSPIILDTIDDDDDEDEMPLSLVRRAKRRTTAMKGKAVLQSPSSQSKEQAREHTDVMKPPTSPPVVNQSPPNPNPLLPSGHRIPRSPVGGASTHVLHKPGVMKQLYADNAPTAEDIGFECVTPHGSSDPGLNGSIQDAVLMPDQDQQTAGQSSVDDERKAGKTASALGDDRNAVHNAHGRMMQPSPKAPFEDGGSLSPSAGCSMLRHATVSSSALSLDRQEDGSAGGRRQKTWGTFAEVAATVQPAVCPSSPPAFQGAQPAAIGLAEKCPRTAAERPEGPVMLQTTGRREPGNAKGLVHGKMEASINPPDASAAGQVACSKKMYQQDNHPCSGDSEQSKPSGVPPNIVDTAHGSFGMPDSPCILATPADPVPPVAVEQAVRKAIPFVVPAKFPPKDEEETKQPYHSTTTGQQSFGCGVSEQVAVEKTRSVAVFNAVENELRTLVGQPMVNDGRENTTTQRKDKPAELRSFTRQLEHKAQRSDNDAVKDTGVKNASTGAGQVMGSVGMENDPSLNVRGKPDGESKKVAGLASSANFAKVAMPSDIGNEVGPSELLPRSCNSAIDSEMAGESRVMVLAEKASPKTTVSWDTQ